MNSPPASQNSGSADISRGRVRAAALFAGAVAAILVHLPGAGLVISVRGPSTKRIVSILNRSSEPLVLVSVEPSCHCVSVAGASPLPRELAPGETAELQAAVTGAVPPRVLPGLRIRVRGANEWERFVPLLEAD